MMRRLVFALLMTLSILLGVVHGAVQAHTHAGTEAHASIDAGYHGAGDGSDERSDVVGDTAQHHHCSAGLTGSSPVVCGQSLIAQPAPVVPLARSLTSLSGPPPTEPPSA